MELRTGFACNLGMTTRHLLSTLALAALLAGCATSSKLPPVQQAPGSAPAGSTPAPVTALSLPAEQKRLADLFRGTPVVFEMTPEGSLRVEVPLKYSFDKGKSVVKPPLAKVLDYVVPSAKASGMKARVTAPGDNGNATLLAQDRAASVRDYLVGKGVPVTHFAGVGPAHGGDSVEVVVGPQ
jgi:outer membrane protein OmpA-like peptidoglycan-associated protein